jgi:hypothetical protein
MIVSTWSNDLNSGIQCQSGHRDIQQIGCMQHTPGMHFYAIATIANVQDPDR